MTTTTGTTPPGTSGESQASLWIRRMFSDIAPRYDLLNHLLSFNIDRAWRKALTRRLAPVLAREDACVLDLCCGTGDVVLGFESIAAAQVIGADFCHPMLIAAHAKAARRGGSLRLMEADAMELPLPNDSLDAISIAFGFRNFANYRTGLQELHRVLKPGGVLAILEFSHPPGRFIKAAYGLYSCVFLPVVGGLISGSREAYGYLPESVRKFPGANELRDMLERDGFAETRFERLSGGIAALHSGVKSAAGGGRDGAVDLVAQP